MRRLAWRLVKAGAALAIGRRLWLEGYAHGVDDERRREDALVSRRAAEALDTARGMVAEAHAVMAEAEHVAAAVLRDLEGAVPTSVLQRIAEALPGDFSPTPAGSAI